MGHPWYVKSARDALEMGYRCIANELNKVLKKKPPGLRIDTERKSKKDSLRKAQEEFQDALPGLRTWARLPMTDGKVCPWTIGQINGDDETWDVSVDDLSVEADTLPRHIEFLLARRKRKSSKEGGKYKWSKEHWQQFIVDPVQKHMEDWRKRLEGTNRTRRGRPKADYEEAQSEARLAADWVRARDSGIYKQEFAKEHDMTKTEFDTLLNRVAKRKSRSDK